MAGILRARLQLENDNGLESMAAFHRWRMASMKTHYGRQLRSILVDVQSDEKRLRRAQVPILTLLARNCVRPSVCCVLKVLNITAHRCKLRCVCGDGSTCRSH